jgi:hypothetical protein
MNNAIQKITTPDLKQNERAETGPLRINDDWAGIFIRGDNALYYCEMLKLVLEQIPEEEKNKFKGVNSTVESLISLLGSCIE